MKQFQKPFDNQDEVEEHKDKRHEDEENREEEEDRGAHEDNQDQDEVAGKCKRDSDVEDVQGPAKRRVSEVVLGGTNLSRICFYQGLHDTAENPT